MALPPAIPLLLAALSLLVIIPETRGFASVASSTTFQVFQTQREWRVPSFMASSVNSFHGDESSKSTLTFMATNEDSNTQSGTLRTRLRRVTGFSMTACRAAMRAATGISLTAVYASALAATSAFVRKTIALILSPLPPWFRYFFQPFLILYFAPIFILRNLAGRTGKQARETHEHFVDGFKAAVDAAEKKADGYWPVHVNEAGEIVSVQQSRQSAMQIDVSEGVAESVEVVMEEKSKSKADTS